jgi:ribosome-associated protein
MNFDALHKELTFRTSRASGSGGQHVNKVSTRVELVFHISDSEVLTDAQKALALKRLSNRINKNGELIIACQESRSQLKNKQLAIARFETLISKAVIPPKKRKKVKPLVANKAKRLDKKKRHAEKKSMRKKIML